MTFKLDKYPDSLKALTAQFNAATAAFPGAGMTVLAGRLIDGAIGFDVDKVSRLGVPASYTGIVRDIADPPEYDCTHAHGAEADDPARPLPQGEQWNEGRRATQAGAVYGLDAKGRPVNPYFNTGLQGRGMLWLYGPNHAIDNGVLVIAPDDTGVETLSFVGITRKDDPLRRPALSGGFAKFAAVNGAYVFDEEAILQTRVEEFFEEMVSDSVPLLPAYEARLAGDIAALIDAHKAARKGNPPAQSRIDEIHEQTATGLKLQQVRDLDPGFLARIEAWLRRGAECFAGPVLASGRNTNNAWIETRLNWVMIDDAAWAGLCGSGPFKYELSGGDDAGSVIHYKIGAAVVGNAVGSHGAAISFMAASFLLKAQEEGRALPPAIIGQLEELAKFLETPPAWHRTPTGPGTA